MPKPETITMTMRQLDRLKVLQALADGHLKTGIAAARLGLSPRQTLRLLRRYQDEGAPGLQNRRQGAPGHRQPDVVGGTPVLAVGNACMAGSAAEIGNFQPDLREIAADHSAYHAQRLVEPGLLPTRSVKHRIGIDETELAQPPAQGVRGDGHIGAARQQQRRRCQLPGPGNPGSAGPMVADLPRRLKPGAAAMPLPRLRRSTRPARSPPAARSAYRPPPMRRSC